MPSAVDHLLRTLRDARDRAIQRLIAERYDRIYRRIDPIELTRHDADISDERLAYELQHREERKDDLFLGFYSPEGIRRALEHYGFCAMLREKGFDDLVVDVDTSDAPRHALRIYDGERGAAHLLIECILQFRELVLRTGHHHPMLSIEWLVMQNPRSGFDPARPALPDQAHPGLGLFRWMAELLRLIAVRLERDGLMTQSAHFHNAALYGKAMHYVDPRDEGQLRALERDLADLSLYEATRAVEDGRVVDDAGHVLRWRGRPQVLPLHLALQRYFRSLAYIRDSTREMLRTHYHVRPEAR